MRRLICQISLQSESRREDVLDQRDPWTCPVAG